MGFHNIWSFTNLGIPSGWRSSIGTTLVGWKRNPSEFPWVFFGGEHLMKIFQLQVMEICFRYIDSALKFNSKFAPDKWGLEDDSFLFGMVNFQGRAVKLRGCFPVQFGAKIWGEPCSLFFQGQYLTKKKTSKNLQEKSTFPGLFLAFILVFTRIGWTYLRHTIQEINISHLGKRKIIFKMDFSGDMLVPRRVSNNNPKHVTVVFLIIWCCSFCPPTLKCFLRIITPPKFGSKSPWKKDGTGRRVPFL